MLWILFPFISYVVVFNLGVLYFLCVSRLEIYSIIISGWSSNSNYSLSGFFFLFSFPHRSTVFWPWRPFEGLCWCGQSKCAKIVASTTLSYVSPCKYSTYFHVCIVSLLRDNKYYKSMFFFQYWAVAVKRYICVLADVIKNELKSLCFNSLFT